MCQHIRFACRIYIKNVPAWHTIYMVYYCVLRQFSQVCLLGRFDFETFSKSALHLLSIARTKMRIGIAVQHQDVCSVAGRRLNSSDNDKKQVYVKIIDNFYVIVHARRRWDVTQHNFKSLKGPWERKTEQSWESLSKLIQANLIQFDW